jgi:uncharacterized YigZ family protein
MEIVSYKTLGSPGEGLYKEKGSKFLGFAFPVADEEQVKEALEALRKKYFDATHHCYAYVLGADRKKFRIADDGEPSHSAGDPIYGQIRSRELTNTLVVVVRYFGGTKLGVGGLITAYKAAADEALNHASIIVKEVVKNFILRYDYSATPEIMKLIKEFDLRILDQQFENLCSLHASYPLSGEKNFLEKIHLLQALGSVKEFIAEN